MLSGVLAPFVESSLAARVESRISAMDASPSCGAVCHVDEPESVAESLWAIGETRGGYTHLEAKARTALRGLGSLSPWVEEEGSFEEVTRSGPPREVATRRSRSGLGVRHVALRMLSLFFVAVRCHVPALLEQPLLSNMCWLPDWRRLLLWPAVMERIAASCAFPSEEQRQPYLKRFCFLTAHMQALSATYNVGLTAPLAEVVVCCLGARDKEAIRQHVP